MSNVPPPAPDTPEPAQSHYDVLAACSLALVALTLMQFDLGLLTALLTVLVGLVGILIRWRAAVIVQLAVLAVVLHLVTTRYSFRVRVDRGIGDLVLAAATLFYCVCHYRLLGLSATIFPWDPRRRKGRPRWQIGFFRLRRKPRMMPTRRSVEHIQPREVALLLMTLPGCAILAQFLWRAVEDLPFHSPVPNPGFPVAFWQLVTLIWIMGVVLALVHAAFGWWAAHRMSAEEAALVLQDTVWQETRREQRYINRWLVWRRQRDQRRKDKR